MSEEQPSEPTPQGDLHRFGSVHTLVKLNALERYLPAFTTALKNKKFRTHYIDAFAGTGVCHVNVSGRRLMVPGSASIAVQCVPKFDRMVFIEKKLRHVRALERLRDNARDREIDVVRSDANDVLPRYVGSLSAGDRAIVFLDPYGMQLRWETLHRIALSKRVDVWYLLPLSAIYRQASRSAAAIDDDKAAALTRIFGTDEWRTSFYDRPMQDSLFGPLPDVRVADTPEILAWVKKRLETIFAGVARPKQLHQVMPSGKIGAPLFALFFAVSNPRAKDLALRIANGVLAD